MNLTHPSCDSGLRQSLRCYPLYVAVKTVFSACPALFCPSLHQWESGSEARYNQGCPEGCQGVKVRVSEVAFSRRDSLPVHSFADPSSKRTVFSLTVSLSQPVTSAIARSTCRSRLHFHLPGGHSGTSPFKPGSSGTHTAPQHSAYRLVPAPSSGGKSREGWDSCAWQLRKPKGGGGATGGLGESCPHSHIQREASRAS